MRGPVTQKEMHERAVLAFRKRSDVGLRQAVKNIILKPGNPFQRQEKRRPARGFVLFLLIAAIMISCFVYFNFY